jgi:hypothetical protein
VLVLAGTDRLDTELMIGQMQGKFRVVVLADCGHCIQEDVRPSAISLPPLPLSLSLLYFALLWSAARTCGLID